MAWYDEPRDFQSDPTYGGTYDPSGGTMREVELPYGRWRYSDETEWRPSTFIWSEQARKWEGIENALHNKRMKHINEINALEGLLQQYEGSGDFITQWLIRNSIDHIRSRMESTDKAIGMGQLAMIRARNRLEGEEGEGWKTPSGAGTRLDQYERFKEMSERPLRTEGQKEFEYEGLEIPDWMDIYMTESGLGKGKGGVPQGAGRGGGEELGMAQRGFGLAPLSARADLEPDDMRALQSYMGWSKAGKPTEYSEEYVGAMQNLPKWWEQYAKLSQELLPQSGKGRQQRWTTARQR